MGSGATPVAAIARRWLSLDAFGAKSKTSGDVDNVRARLLQSSSESE